MSGCGDNPPLHLSTGSNAALCQGISCVCKTKIPRRLGLFPNKQGVEPEGSGEVISLEARTWDPETWGDRPSRTEPQVWVKCPFHK